MRLGWAQSWWGRSAVFHVRRWWPVAVVLATSLGVQKAFFESRYDVSGPLDTAWDLHRAWPASRLIVLADAGHGGTDMTSALVEALDGFRDAR